MTIQASKNIMSKPLMAGLFLALLALPEAASSPGLLRGNQDVRQLTTESAFPSSSPSSQVPVSAVSTAISSESPSAAPSWSAAPSDMQSAAPSDGQSVSQAPSSAPSQNSTAPPSDGSIESKSPWTKDQIISALSDGDFAVREGFYSPGNAQKAYDTGKMPDANGNNQGHAYNMALVPPLEGQEAPSSLSLLRNNTLYNAAYRMRSDEAVVFVGKTPYNIDYFSFRSYLMFRYFPEDSGIRKLFNSLGDTLNLQRNFQEIGFNEPFVFVSVASEQTLKNVQDSLNGIVPSDRIFVDKIPMGILNLGLDWTNDQIGILARFGNPSNAKALKEYSLNALGRSGTFLRVTPNTETETIPLEDQFPYTLISRDTPGNSADAYEINRYYSGFQDLRSSILTTWMGKNYNPTEYETSVWLTEGIDGIQRRVDLVGEDRDTLYLKSQPFTLEKGEVAVVYGVHHSAVNSSVYNSFAVYNTDVDSGIVGVNSANDTFAGGADSYLSSYPNVNASQFYVWHIQRGDEASDYTITVPSQLKYEPVKVTSSIGNQTQALRLNHAEVIPDDSLMDCRFRAYVNPATGVGPSSNEIIYDRVIKFTPTE